MAEQTTRGVLFFAINNEHVDYLKMALMSALFVKRNMGDVSCSVVTTEESMWWDYYKDNEALFKETFEYVILIDNPKSQKNDRVFRDTNYHSVMARFDNFSRPSAYELSPYDETLLMDTDYFVMNDSLNSVWGCAEDILINRDAINLNHTPLSGPEHRLSPYGIRMFWATVVYFKKSERIKLLFDLCKHIRERWEFYKLIYEFSGNLYRNDFAFSIALHMLNGFLENEEIRPLPGGPILSAIDRDQFFKLRGVDEMLLFYNDPTQDWKFTLSNVKGINVHCMNKLSILNQADEMIEVLRG